MTFPPPGPGREYSLVVHAVLHDGMLVWVPATAPSRIRWNHQWGWVDIFGDPEFVSPLPRITGLESTDSGLRVTAGSVYLLTDIDQPTMTLRQLP